MLTRRRILIIVRGLVTVVLLAYLISLIEWDHLMAILPTIEKGFLFIAPVILFIGLLFSSIRWQHLLGCFNIRQNIKKFYAYYLIGNFYSIFLPGVIGGDIIRIGICASETKSPIRIIMTSTIIERACGIIVLFIIGSLFTFTLPSNILISLGKSITKTLPFVTGFGLFALSTLFLLFRKIPGKYTGKPNKTGLINKIMDILNLVARLPLPSIFFLIFSSALFQASDIFASFIIAKALNINLPLSLFFAIMPIVYIGTILPVSLGGLGVREGAFVYLLAKVGITASDALALAFLIYFNRIVIGSVGGIIHIFWKSRGVDKCLTSIRNIT